jgi:hypothetical protein
LEQAAGVQVLPVLLRKMDREKFDLVPGDAIELEALTVRCDKLVEHFLEILRGLLPGLPSQCASSVIFSINVIWHCKQNKKCLSRELTFTASMTAAYSCHACALTQADTCTRAYRQQRTQKRTHLDALSKC